MSKRWSRLALGALAVGLLGIATAAPVQASSPAAASRPAAALPPESAALTRFRDSGPPVMQQAAQIQDAAPIHTYAAATPVKAAALAASNPRLFREVFGFAFSNSLGDPTIGYPSWNFSLLSTVAYFGLHVDWTGAFSSGSGLTTWNDPNGPVPGFIQTAHANGTKVVLTIEMFDSTSGTPNMCSALSRGSLTIQNTVAQVRAKGIDGVNVDYESNNTPCTDSSGTHSSQSMFTNFVAQLRAALPSGSYLSVDTYSGAAGFRDGTGAYLGFFDVGGLANYVDSFFVMAYDMEYANASAAPLNCPSFCIGPTAPLSTYLFNDTRATQEYTAVVPASKIIMGVPYYGRKECVAGHTPFDAPANAEGTAAAADGYLDASTENGYVNNSNYVTHTETRDPLSATRWDTFTSSTANCTRELYWDDANAIGNKYDLVIRNHLRGAGIFALNYGGGAPELWSLINLKFGKCSEAAISSDKTSPQIPGASVTFTGSALCAGTAEYRFWIQPPGGSFSLQQDHSTSATWTWNTTGLPLGQYTVQVDARNQGSASTLDTYSRMTFQLALCVTPTLTSDKAPPQLLGTAITFTPAVTCQGTPEYRFWVQPPGGSWSIAQDYGVASTFRWDTSALGYGNYNIGVHVRTAGTSVPYESYTSTPYSLTSCMSAALASDKASPQPTGTSIGLTGSATCAGTAQYRFMIQPPGGSWSVVQDFQAAPTFTWNASGAGGTYNLELDAKSASAPVSAMASAGVAYQLTACSAVTLTTSLASPQQPGPTVTLTGAATCPGTPQYRFLIDHPDGSLSVVQDYGPASTYAWSTAGQALGPYGLRVDVRDAGAATTSYEAVATMPYYLGNPPCTAPTVATDLATPQGTGTAVTFTATTTTCPQPLYEFWLQPPGSTTWILGRPYSTDPSFRWDTRGAPAGTYQLSAWVRDTFSGSATPSGLGGTYDAFTGFADTLTTTPCTSTTVTASPVSPSGSGTQVTLTGASTCAHPTPLYEFWMRPAGLSSWWLLQGWSTTATVTWNSAGALLGTEQLGVWVRDASSGGTIGSGSARYDDTGGAPYSIVGPSCASVTASASPASPTGHGTGAQVTVTAVAAGCTDANPLFEFWMLPAGSTRWVLLQGYTTTATYTWNTNGAPAGTERFGVWVRDARSSAAYDTYVGLDYTLS
ncbi:MAG TPA: glycosyl hydrolase family 18 protein [Candidatus Dormibacteraeota bacterium]